MGEGILSTMLSGLSAARRHPVARDDEEKPYSSDCPPTCSPKQIEQIKNRIRLNFVSTEALWVWADGAPKKEAIDAYVDKKFSQFMNDPTYYRYGGQLLDQKRIKNDIAIGKALIKYASNHSVKTFPNVEALATWASYDFKPKVGSVITDDQRRYMVRDGMLRLARHNIPIPQSVKWVIGTMYPNGDGSFIDAQKVMDAMDKAYGGGLFEGKEKDYSESHKHGSAFDPMPIIFPSGDKIAAQIAAAQQQAVQAASVQASNPYQQAGNQWSAQFFNPGPGISQGPSGAQFTQSTADFLPSAPITVGPSTVEQNQLPSGATGWQTIPDPISGEPIQIPVYGDPRYPSESSDIQSQYPGIYTKSLKRKRRLHGLRETDQGSVMASTLPAAIGAVIGLALGKKRNRTESLMMGAAAGYIVGFALITRK